ncbi:site-specific integrase [Betaproteobacteria bacterium LSUCC0117]|nr:site-specific integrase [Betaproteobacteria bacterium LSUCC0117]
MAQARALNAAEMEQVLTHVNASRHAHRNRCFILLTHLAGMRVGEVASLRWVDVLTADGHIKEEIRLLPEMTKGKHARTVFISTRLREELQRYADIYRRSAPLECPLFYSQKDARKGFTANSLTQTVAKIYRGAGLDGATSHSGRRSFLTNLANKGTAIHLLRTLAGHRSISTTATYLYSSPTQLKAAVELA